MYFEIRTVIEGYNKCKAIFDIYKKLGYLNIISAPLLKSSNTWGLLRGEGGEC